MQRCKAAKEKCDLCSKNAPFKKKKTNEPYLECHHVKLLVRGREDIIDNAVALCPNCHRKMHSLSLKSDIKKLFTKIEKRN
jgi:5-methylcytosine-specific restriction protein A